LVELVEKGIERQRVLGTNVVVHRDVGIEVVIERQSTSCGGEVVQRNLSLLR